MESITCRHSLFKRIVSVFILCTVLLNTLAFIAVNICRVLLSSSIQRAHENEHHYFASTFNMELERIISMQYIISINWDITRTAFFPESKTSFEKWKLYQQVSNTLWGVHSSSSAIQNVSLYIPTADIAVSTLKEVKCKDMKELTEKLIDYPENKPFYLEEEFLLYSPSQISIENKPAFYVISHISGKDVSAAFQKLSVPDRHDGYGAFLYNEAWFEHSPLKDIPPQVTDMLSPSVLESAIPNQLSSIRTNDHYTIFYSVIADTDLFLVSYIDENTVYAPLQRVQWLLGLLFIVSTLALIGFSLFTRRVVNVPLLRLISAFNRTKEGTTDCYIEHHQQDEFGILFDEFNRMLRQLNRYIDINFRQTILLQKAQLKQLQSQIEPHFLYNCFFILNRRIRSANTSDALSLSQRLGEFFQYAVHTDEDSIALANEIRHAYNYCKIQCMRFPNRVTLQIEEPPEEIRGEKVPMLIIQPLCENTFVHYIEKTTHLTTLRISYAIDERASDILIEDDNTSITDEQIGNICKSLASSDESERISGTINIHRRLTLAYPEGSGIYPSRSEALGGLLIRLHIVRMSANEQNPRR